MAGERLRFPNATEGTYCDATHDTDGSLIIWLHGGESPPPLYRVSAEITCVLVQRVIHALSRHRDGDIIKVELRPERGFQVMAGRHPDTCRLGIELGRSTMFVETPRAALQRLAEQIAALGEADS